MSLDLSDKMQLTAYLLRDWHPELTGYIKPRCPQKGLFFDVGANVGLVTFAVAAQRPDVRIHAFEPSRPNIESWQRNRLLNACDRSTLVEAAVSDHENGAYLNVLADSGSGVLSDRGDRVRTVTLDAYCAREGISQVDILKIDVQGHELGVLRGALGLLGAQAIRTVIVEMDIDFPDEDDPVAILAGFGYNRVPIASVGMYRRLTGQTYEQDVAFEA